MYEKEIVKSGIPEKLAIALFTLVGAGFASFHAMFQMDLVFQLFFGILCWFCLLRLIGHYATVQDPRARTVARSAMHTIIVGFSFWLIDYHYCGAMQALPVNPQGHAWWHVLMGVCTYHGPVFMQYVRAEELQQKAEIIDLGFGLHTIVIHDEHTTKSEKKTL
jgi:dihydroceramidase